MTETKKTQTPGFKESKADILELFDLIEHDEIEADFRINIDGHLAVVVIKTSGLIKDLLHKKS